MDKDKIPSDGRAQYEYCTKYIDCKRKIIRDASYLAILFIIAIILLLFNYLNLIGDFFGLVGDKKVIFEKITYCILSGLLGGTTFGIKYFYRVVARGYWTEDRIFWRIFSPWISVALSLVMASILIKDVSSSSSMAITVGFLTGYFSDEAVSKMYDVACVLFLKNDYKNDKRTGEDN